MVFGYLLCVLSSSLNEGSSSGTACVCDLRQGSGQGTVWGKLLLLRILLPCSQWRRRSSGLAPARCGWSAQTALLARSKGRLCFCSLENSLMFLRLKAPGGSLGASPLSWWSFCCPWQLAADLSSLRVLRRFVAEARIFSSETRPWCGVVTEGSGVRRGLHSAIRHPERPDFCNEPLWSAPCTASSLSCFSVNFTALM